MTKERPNHPEPVPAASQITILPFLSAIHGSLAKGAGKETLRITMHRVMSRDGDGYLQQVCSYLGTLKNSQTPVGRMFSVDTGIMGLAFGTKKIQRTKHYSDIETLYSDLEKDLTDNGDNRAVEETPVSYLAIPMLGPDGSVVTTLYAECNVFGFFANDDRVTQLVEMCQGLCELLDWFAEEQPFPTIRNYPLEVGELQYTTSSVFKRIREEFDMEPPRFKLVTSLNFDASVG